MESKSALLRSSCGANSNIASLFGDYPGLIPWLLLKEVGRYRKEIVKSLKEIGKRIVLIYKSFKNNALPK
jgi:hypothetical protein